MVFLNARPYLRYYYFLTAALFQILPNLETIKFPEDFNLTMLAIVGCPHVRLVDFCQSAKEQAKVVIFLNILIFQLFLSLPSRRCNISNSSIIRCIPTLPASKKAPWHLEFQEMIPSNE
jgi:hypothetical protein